MADEAVEKAHTAEGLTHAEWDELVNAIGDSEIAALVVPIVGRMVSEPRRRLAVENVVAAALDDVDRRLAARIGEGREDPETEREGSYFSGFLDALESARSEVRWKRPDPTIPHAPQRPRRAPMADEAPEKDQVEERAAACRVWEARHAWNAYVADDQTLEAAETFVDNESEYFGVLLDEIRRLRRLLAAQSFTERVDYETRMEWHGCHCGHPGAGCYCQSTRVRTGRFRVVREFASQVGEWQEKHVLRPGADS